MNTTPPQIEMGEISGSIPTSIQSTNISQRDKLEETIINLSTIMGIKKIYKARGARGNTYYMPDGQHMLYQSATNTIYELSQKLIEAANEDQHKQQHKTG